MSITKYISLFSIVLIPLLGLSQKQKQPNVLLIVADDLNTALSGFGHPQCKTPNLDKLAERGVKFNKMYSQYPLCGPSRASFMSGLYPYSNNCINNPDSYLRKKNPDIVTLSQAFKNNGYHTARVSKIYHMSIPMEIISGKARFDDPLSWDEAHNIKNPEANIEGIKNNWSPKKKGSQSFISVEYLGSETELADGMAAEKAIETMSKIKDKPFFLAVGMVRPHVPLVATKKHFDLYEREKMILPKVPSNDLDDVPVLRNTSETKQLGVTPELHKGLLQAYYASVSYMDAQVGKVLKALKDNGLQKNTIVVFSSDHGYMLGEHFKFQKKHLFEESIRVPFIVSVPWLKSEHGKSTHQITELVDLYPTLTDLANIKSVDNLQGKSFKSLLENTNSINWNKEYAFTIAAKGGEALIGSQWKYIHWNYGNKKEIELYDLKNDPNEFNNLILNPNYKAIAEKLKKQLLLKRINSGFNAEKIRALEAKVPIKNKKKKKTH